MAKKGKMTLPRVDRSRALPVRTGWGLYKTVLAGALLAVVIVISQGHAGSSEQPQDPAVVVTQ